MEWELPHNQLLEGSWKVFSCGQRVFGGFDGR